MIKYIYYRVSERYKELERLDNTMWELDPFRFSNDVHKFFFLPFAVLGAMLMWSEHWWTSCIGFVPIYLLAYYLSNRFEKRMQTYQPPERFRKLDAVPVNRFVYPLFALLFLWAFGSIALSLLFVVAPYDLVGWLYNHLFQGIL